MSSNNTITFPSKHLLDQDNSPNAVQAWPPMNPGAHNYGDLSQSSRRPILEIATPNCNLNGSGSSESSFYSSIAAQPSQTPVSAQGFGPSEPSSPMDKYPQASLSNYQAPINPIRGPRQPGRFVNGVFLGNFARDAPVFAGHPSQLDQPQGGRGIMGNDFSTTGRPYVNPGGRAPNGAPINMAPQTPAPGDASTFNDLARQMAGASITDNRRPALQAPRQFVSRKKKLNGGGAPPGHGYRAMEVVGRPYRLNPNNDPQRELKAKFGISPNYGGDASIARNQSANIPDSENCSLWITNLPAGCTHNMLLSQVRGFGRIYCCVINPPDALVGHSTAAAKLVFFELKAAQRFFAMCSNPARRLMVGSRVAKVSLNRIKSEEHDTFGHKSRCLKITGEINYVNPGTLTDWFEDRFVFDIDEIIKVIETEEMGVVEFRFGSWRCQAEAARMALFRDFNVGLPGCPIWEVHYAKDPCSDDA